MHPDYFRLGTGAPGLRIGRRHCGQADAGLGLRQKSRGVAPPQPFACRSEDRCRQRPARLCHRIRFRPSTGSAASTRSGPDSGDAGSDEATSPPGPVYDIDDRRKAPPTACLAPACATRLPPSSIRQGACPPPQIRRRTAGAKRRAHNCLTMAPCRPGSWRTGLPASVAVGTSSTVTAHSVSGGRVRTSSAVFAA